MRKTMVPADSRLGLAGLVGSPVNITGTLARGRNGSTGKLVLSKLHFSIGRDGLNDGPVKPLPTGIAEYTVPDSAFSSGLRPGSTLPPDGLFEPEIFQKLPANTCVILKGKEGGQKAGRIILGVKKGNMLRIVQRPKDEDDETRFVQPKSIEHAFAFDLAADPDIKFVAMYGFAGTGKTVTAIVAGLKLLKGLIACGQSVLDNERGENSSADQNPCHVLVVRPVCPIGKELGFLPGDLGEKTEPWAQAILDAEHYICVCTGQTDLTKNVEVTTVTHMRGRTLNNELVVIDDAQNFQPKEMLTLLTRIASTSKVVITGDPDQIDTRGLNAQFNGLDHVIRRMIGWEQFACVRLVKNLRCPIAAEVAERLK